MSFGKTEARRRGRTIGFRLTLWGAGITCVVCVLLCAILYTGMYFSLRGEIDGFIEGEAHELIAMLAEHPNDYPAAQEAMRLELGSRSRRDLIFRVLSLDGKLLISSDPRDALPCAPPAIKDLSTPAFATVAARKIRFPIRTCTLGVRSADGKVLYAQAAYVLERMTTSLAELRRICGIGLVIAVLVSFVGGRILATRSLRPVAALAQSARKIGAARMSDRLPRTGTGDELDQLAETLNDMLGRIEDQVRQIQQFTADASHELRSPLTALRGNAEVALTQNRSAEQLRQTIEESIEHYDRLSRIAEDLLLLARLDAGEQILQRQPVRLDDAVADMVDLYAPSAAERDVSLTFARREEVWLNGDGARLRQLVGNLIDNAVKYTQAPGSVTVSLIRENGRAELAVRDTGVGISAEELPRIFDRFYRADRARTAQRAGGAGLGLAICRGIAEAHGGRVDAQSAPGRGTTVTVRFPPATG